MRYSAAGALRCHEMISRGTCRSPFTIRINLPHCRLHISCYLTRTENIVFHNPCPTYHKYKDIIYFIIQIKIMKVIEFFNNASICRMNFYYYVIFIIRKTPKNFTENFCHSIYIYLLFDLIFCIMLHMKLILIVK